MAGAAAGYALTLPAAPPPHPASFFLYRDNYHQIADWPTKLDIDRMLILLVSMHGKNICDALSNSIASTLRGAVERGDIVEPSTRNLVLYLAEHYKEPATAKSKKEGWWAVSDVVYGYLDPSCFTQSAVPSAQPLPKSDSYRRYIGRSRHHDAARDGPLEFSPHFCGCINCCKYDFGSCLMHGLGGLSTRLMKGNCKRANTNAGLTSLSADLDTFAQTEVKANSLGVVAADIKEQHIEGGYWLCLVLCKPYKATRREACATDVIEEGWWVVKIQWYAYEHGTSPRQYKLLPETRLLAVNAMVRIKDVRFETKERASRSGFQVLGEEAHKNIQMSLPYITVGVDVCGPGADAGGARTRTRARN